MAPTSRCVLLSVFVLLSLSAASAKPGQRGSKCKKSPCADGSHPACPDGSKPDRGNGSPTCSSGGEALCKDGSEPQPPKRKLQGRGGKGGKGEDDDCERNDNKMFAVVFGVGSVIAACAVFGAGCWWRAARLAKAQTKVGQESNVANIACVMGQPVVHMDMEKNNSVVPAEIV